MRFWLPLLLLLPATPSALGQITLPATDEVCSIVQASGGGIVADPAYAFDHDLVVPVFFHIIMDDAGVGNVTQAQIDDQIEALNFGFDLPPIGSPLVSFRLAGISRTYNSD